MQRGNLDDLSAFLIVAREGNFTKAAARPGVSQSALSYTIKQLEARLMLRLLTRATRSLSPTAAGERLLRHVGPRLEEIETELAVLSELREKPSGTVRITATENATSAVLLAKLLREYPDVKVEIISDYGLIDIVTQRFDAGVRDGEQVAKDMIAVRIGPDSRMAVVGAPSYFRNRPEPKKPQELVEHNSSICACPPMADCTRESKRSRQLKVRLEGQLIFNTTSQMLHAAFAGLGLTYLPEGLVQPHLNRGRLKRVLGGWCPSISGVSPLLPRPAAALRSLCAAGRSVALPGLRGSNRRLRAKHNRRGLDKLERPDHFLRRRLVFPEMRGLEVRPVGFRIPVDFEHFHARGAILFRNSVQDKYAWLDADSGFRHGSSVRLELRGIDLDFRHLDVVPLFVFTSAS
jgi:DNA-binding transcriptional LysR family regulator